MSAGAAAGIAGHALSGMLMAILVRRGLLSKEDAAEVVEHALLSLETHGHHAEEADQPDFAEARKILTYVRQAFPLEE